MLSDMPTAALLLSLALSLTPTASAQEDATVARLRAQVAAAPTDASLRCQLAFALVGAGAHAEARQQATDGMAAIARPLSARTRRTLAACLYNRGRALEALSETRDAVADYVASIHLRPNDTVRARLDALVPNVPAALPAAAMVAMEDGSPELVADQTPVSVRAGGGVTWHFVTARTFGHGGLALLVFAITVRGEGRALVRELDSWEQEDFQAPIRVVSARALPALAASAAVMLSIEATGGGACGRMDGFMDFEHHATAFVALLEEHVVSRTLVTRQSDCEGHVSTGLRVRGASVEITRTHGGDLEPGAHTIESILR